MVGSIYASLYAGRLAGAGLPDPLVSGARRSVGAALVSAGRLDQRGSHDVAAQLRDAASGAFFHGFQTAVLVASAVALLGGIAAAALIPAQPPAASLEIAPSQG